MGADVYDDDNTVVGAAQDQGTQDGSVIKDAEPNGGSARPKRSPNPNPKYSPEEYDLGDVKAKEDSTADDDTIVTVEIGPEVPKVHEGGDDIPAQVLLETEGLSSMMTKQELFDPGGGGSITKSRGTALSFWLLTVAACDH